MSLDKIDDLISYIESPEYLRMVASAQGENAYALLGADSYAPGTAWVCVFEPDHSVPTGSVFEPLDEPTPARRPRRAPRTAARQLSTRDGWWKFGECLGSRVPFKTYGKFKGVDAPKGTGILPAEYAHAFNAVHEFIDYVVYSYATPIAWHVWNPGITGVSDPESYWVMPDTRYSVTTSRHQTKIRVALAESGDDVRP